MFQRTKLKQFFLIWRQFSVSTYRQILTGLKLNNGLFADLSKDLEESISQVSFNILMVCPAFSFHEKNVFWKKIIGINKACAQIAAVL